MWWEEQHSPTPLTLTRAGHQVINVGWWPLYYVTGGPLTDLRTPADQMYEDWIPSDFSGPYTSRWATPQARPPTRLDPDDPLQTGAMLAIWNDDPSSPGAAEQAVASGIAPRLQILGQKAWGSPELVDSYEDFRAIAARVSR
jgi:hypothetical protein